MKTNTLMLFCSCAGVQDPLNRFVDRRPILTWGKVDVIVKPAIVTVLANPKELWDAYHALMNDIRFLIETSKNSDSQPTIKRLIIVNHPKCKFRKKLQLDGQDFCQTTELLLAEKNLQERAVTQKYVGKKWRTEEQEWIKDLEILLFFGKATEKGLAFRIIRKATVPKKQGCCQAC